MNLKFGGNFFELWLAVRVDTKTIEQVLSAVTPDIPYVFTNDRVSMEDQLQTSVYVETLNRENFPTRIMVEWLSDSVIVARPLFETLHTHFGCAIIVDPPDTESHDYLPYEWLLFDGQDWWLVDDQLAEPPEFRITGPAPPIENESQNELGSDSP
jgi:hypothetical protein